MTINVRNVGVVNPPRITVEVPQSDGEALEAWPEPPLPRTVR